MKKVITIEIAYNKLDNDYKLHCKYLYPVCKNSDVNSINIDVYHHCPKEIKQDIKDILYNLLNTI